MQSRKLVAVFLTCWLVLLQTFPALAANEELEQKKKELDSVQQRMQQAQQQQENASQQIIWAKGDIRKVTALLAQLQKDIVELEKRADALQKDIDKNQAQLNVKRGEMEGRLKIYRARLRQIYENGQINYLDVLLGAKDFGDFASRMYLLQKIVQSDLNLVATVRREADAIQKRQDRLDSQMKEIYSSAASDVYKRQEYDRMLAISDNIKALLQSLESSSSMPSNGGNGSFIWPCSGPITSYYGWRTHPIFGTRRYHSGLDIGVDTGTPIHAAANGVIIYSGWMGGYGYAIMIDHGGGLTTIYGHNSRLAVSEGQHVTQGQVVAYAGSTGYSTGPHCHFEVRLHGEVVSPLNYLP